MKQICAACKSSKVVLISTGTSSDRIESYTCQSCGINFYAKRPTQRVRQRERQRQELVDNFAGLAMQTLMTMDKSEKSQIPRLAYNIAEAMIEEREGRLSR